VTGGQFPQMAGSLGLNGGGAATMVPPQVVVEMIFISNLTTGFKIPSLLDRSLRCY